MNKLLTITLALLTCSASAAEPIPNRYQFDYTFLSQMPRSRPYYECDYTSRTCFRGVSLMGMTVGEVLADDRKTVLGHIGMIRNMITINYDTGEVTSMGRKSTIPDMPAFCLDHIPGPGQGTGEKPCVLTWQSGLVK
jgi:hypothetical protein